MNSNKAEAEKAIESVQQLKGNTKLMNANQIVVEVRSKRGIPVKKIAKKKAAKKAVKTAKVAKSH